EIPVGRVELSADRRQAERHATGYVCPRIRPSCQARIGDRELTVVHHDALRAVRAVADDRIGVGRIVQVAALRGKDVDVVADYGPAGWAELVAMAGEGRQ